MPHELNLKKRLIKVGLEDDYGVAPNDYVYVPFRTGAASKIEPEMYKLEHIVPTNSPQGQLVVSTKQTFSGEVDVYTSGVDASGNIIVPEWDTLLQATGHGRTAGLVISVSGVTGNFIVGETVQKDTDVIGQVYSINISQNTGTLFLFKDAHAPLVTANDSLSGALSGATATVVTSSPAWGWYPITDVGLHKSMTVSDNTDTYRKLLTGCRGGMKLTFKVKEPPKLNIELEGLDNDPSNVPITYPDYEIPEPIVCKAVLIGVGDLTMEMVSIESFEIDMGTTKSPMPDIKATAGVKEVTIEKREPSITINPTSLSLDGWNPLAILKTHQLQKMFLQVGPNLPGQRLRVDVPAAQFESVDDSGERVGKKVNTIKCVPNGRVSRLWDKEIIFWVF